MDSRFKKLFLRKRSKSKALLISEPIHQTFRQTAGYDGFAAGPSPTIGAWPIKPSDESGGCKSLSRIRTKSVGSQESRQLAHTSTEPRPRAASEVHPSQEDVVGHSRGGQDSHISEDGVRLRSKSMQGPSNVPELPKGMGKRGYPKHFDLLQAAAVSISKPKTPEESTQTPFDLYNESVANRNSRYSNPLALTWNDIIPKASSPQADPFFIPTQATDSQRASFDAMRASRHAKGLRGHSQGGAVSDDVTSSAIEHINDAGTESPSRSSLKQYWLESDRSRAQDVPPPQTPSAGRQMKRNSGKQAALRSHRLSESEERPSTAIPAAHKSSLLAGSRFMTTRQRSKAGSVLATSKVVAEDRARNESTTLVLNAFGDRSSLSAAGGPALISSSSSFNPRKELGRSLGLDQSGVGLHYGITSDYVPPRVSSDRSTRHREKKRHSRDLPSAAIIVGSQQIQVNETTSEKKGSPIKVITDLTDHDAGRRQSEGDENDYDVGIEEAVPQLADPVQILRASVVSSNGYFYKRGDRVIVGKVLHHRPRPRSSQVENSTIADVRIGSENHEADIALDKDSTLTPVSAGISAATLQSPPDMTAPSSTSPRPSTPISDAAVITNGSLQIPPGKAPEARARLPKSRYFGNSHSSERNRQAESIELPISRSNTVNSSPAMGIRPINALDDAPDYGDLQPTLSQDADALPMTDVGNQDFACSSISTPNRLSGSFELPQPMVNDSITTSIDREARNGSLGGYIHIRQEELEYDSSDLDRSIAIKKKAAAKALLRLQEVMAMPTWQQPSNLGPVTAAPRRTVHWRGLSIEDGGPIAPSAIFNRVKMPVSQPSLSRGSNPSDQDERFSSDWHNNVTNGAGGFAPSPSAHPAMNAEWPNSMQEESLISTTASAAPRQALWPEQRGRSDKYFPEAQRSHARMGSSASVASGNSAHSLPYHMVPARGSSLRDSWSSNGDFGESPKRHGDNQSWQ